MIWHLFWLVVVGGLTGVLADVILPGNEPGPVVAGTLGIVGAAIADYITVRLAWSTQTDGLTLVTAIVGAIVLVILAYLVTRIWSLATR